MSIYIKHALWDLDGTLLDSGRLHHDSIIYASELYGYKLSINYVIPHGFSSKEIFNSIFGVCNHNSQLYDDWYLATIEYVLNNFGKARIFHNSTILFKQLSELGVRQSLVSNSALDIMNKSAEFLGIESMCFNLVSKDNAPAAKPSPLIYEYAMHYQQANLEDCIVFEDSEIGIKSAQSAGLKVVGVINRLDGEDFKIEPNYKLSIKQTDWLYELKCQSLEFMNHHKLTI